MERTQQRNSQWKKLFAHIFENRPSSLIPKIAVHIYDEQQWVIVVQEVNAGERSFGLLPVFL